ncbi:MAG TPA: Glu-tRNA(Gln) amidotransferase subunit GatD [Euryarchaeota archaeon]|nr:L-asparaginase 1 [archaeon BMS3Bbin16]HDH27999.1 Glu-tRNA(Gln) amidotransferase subunit GatD [Euryarchaeota archaeon]
MYRGKAAGFLSGIEVGDIVEVTSDGKTFKGVLMPRNELADDLHIVIKLDTGYNIGIAVGDKTEVVLIKRQKTSPAVAAEAKISIDPDLPTITILGTGGTIASKIDYKTGAVAPAFSAAELHAAIPELSSVANIKTKMLFNILSEDMTPGHWQTIAREAASELNSGAEGVIVAHGTDTMGYTAAAMSFMLTGLGKPVVLVGSQRSSDRPSSDSAMNLLAATRVAIADCAGVFVVMHASMSDDYCLIHRGTRVRKMHSSRRDAFRSINTLPVGRVDEVVEFFEDIGMRSEGKVEVNDKLEPDVALVKVYPGMKEDVLRKMVESHRGVVVEGTGLGHMPAGVLPAVERAGELGVPVVMTSQTLYGRVDLKVYATGRRLVDLGVIPGGDMLPETALVKLMHILGQTHDRSEISRLMQTDLCGELSDVSRPDTFLR